MLTPLTPWTDVVAAGAAQLLRIGMTQPRSQPKSKDGPGWQMWSWRRAGASRCRFPFLVSQAACERDRSRANFTRGSVSRAGRVAQGTFEDVSATPLAKRVSASRRAAAAISAPEVVGTEKSPSASPIATSSSSPCGTRTPASVPARSCALPADSVLTVGTRGHRLHHRQSQALFV